MRSALKRVGVALAGALLASSVVVAPAHAEPATLSGTITAADTGDPLEVCVTVSTLDPDDTSGGVTCTDEAGHWEVGDLTPGQQYIVFANYRGSDRWFATAWLPGVQSEDLAARFTAPGTADFAWQPDGQVSGAISFSDGSPADYAGVSFYPVGQNRAAAVASSFDGGRWRLNLPGGSYQVRYLGYGFDQWEDGAASRATAAVIEVPARTDTTTLDEVLSVPATPAISGRIVGDDTGEGLDACVTAVRASDGAQLGSDCTSDDPEGSGHYEILGLDDATDYKLRVESYDGVHLGEWAQDARSVDEATAFTTPAVVDVSLAPGGILAGRMTRSDGSPAGGTSVTIEPVDGGEPTYAWAEQDGSWRAVVPPGDYTVNAYLEGSFQWLFGARSQDSAHVFSVTSGETVDASDRFVADATVSGMVRADATGAPVAGACVDVFRLPVADWVDTVASACTDDTGAYSVAVPDEGSFGIRFSDPNGRYVAEVHDGAPDAAHATPVELHSGDTRTIDASLAPAATITGLAIDAKLGTPLQGACPDAYVGHAGARVEGQVGTCSDASGRWTIAGLPAGSYAVHLGMGYGPYPSGDVWAFKADTQAQADLVTVKAGTTKTIRNVKIDPPVTISGRITDPFGKPVAGATVNPRGDLMDRSGECFDCATTDQDGRYTVGPIAAGTYRPVAYTGYGVGPWAPEWVGGSTSFEGATPLTIKPGKAGSFSAQLAQASTISGELLNADGSPAGEGWIGFVESPTGRHMGDFDVFGGNTFNPVVLPAGEYRIHLQNAETGQEAWYDGASTAAGATRVTLAEGENRTLTIHLP
ncbi:carboxypeptidase-like regulatory domain-containing protein [Intrasporangium sp. YIM S08009]|uniref:MSCRAMM family protein n=1 Tax=Intrasporangium zincisolvens TaxID=3080018 RepID=UPI002B0552EB|nr:carboxypeptidase-like regulatory domain-containing protein [Intrasporangium sp. YIM S08009]